MPPGARGVQVSCDCDLSSVAGEVFDLIALPGRMLTAYPSFAEQLHNRSHAGSRTVIDGNLVTGQGPGTTFEFALALVEILFGRDKRQEVAEPMVLWNFRESRSG